MLTVKMQATWCEVEKLHPDPNDPDSRETLDEENGQFPEGMFRFEKRIIK